MTLEKWSYGAKARLLLYKKKRDIMHTITNLKKPILVDGQFQEDPDLKKCLMPKADFILWLRANSKNYIWDNYFEDLNQTKTSKKERIYRGMRLKRQTATWEGLG